MEKLRYQAGGQAMESELFLPAGSASPPPAVLVFPEVFGLNDHARERAERLAAAGFAAVACDIHGVGRLFTDLGEAMGAVEPLRADAALIRAVAGGAIAALQARGDVDATRLGAVGFCFGGTLALELARANAPIQAVVAFHAGLATAAPATTRPIARILVCTGAEDPYIPSDQRHAFEEEMRAVGADWQLHVYGNAVHSFTNKLASVPVAIDGLRYDEKADRRSWASAIAFLKTELGVD